MSVRLAKPLLVLTACAATACACAEADLEKVVLSLEVDEHTDGPALAYQLVRTFLSEEAWQHEVAQVREKFETWQADNRGRIDQYLNDRLLGKAMGAAGGEIPKMQRSMIWLALYKEFGQQAHPAVLKFLKEHRGSFGELMKAFSWAKASAYVKEKKWRQDLEAKKDEPDEPEVQTAGAQPPAKPMPPEPKVKPVMFPWTDGGAQVYSRPVRRDRLEPDREAPPNIELGKE